MCGKFKIQNSSVRVLLKLLAFQSSPTDQELIIIIWNLETWKRSLFFTRKISLFLQRKILLKSSWNVFFLTCTKYIVLFKSDLKCFNGRLFHFDVFCFFFSEPKSDRSHFWVPVTFASRRKGKRKAQSKHHQVEKLVVQSSD